MPENRTCALLSASLLFGVSACATSTNHSEAVLDARYARVTERREFIAGYTRTLAVSDLLDVGECQTMDSVPVLSDEPPRFGPTLRQRFRAVRLSETETRAAYTHYRYICALGEGELARTTIPIPESDPERTPE